MGGNYWMSFEGARQMLEDTNAVAEGDDAKLKLRTAEVAEETKIPLEHTRGSERIIGEGTKKIQPPKDAIRGYILSQNLTHIFIHRDYPLIINGILCGYSVS